MGSRRHAKNMESGRPDVDFFAGLSILQPENCNRLCLERNRNLEGNSNDVYSGGTPVRLESASACGRLRNGQRSCPDMPMAPLRVASIGVIWRGKPLIGSWSRQSRRADRHACSTYRRDASLSHGSFRRFYLLFCSSVGNSSAPFYLCTDLFT